MQWAGPQGWEFGDAPRAAHQWPKQGSPRVHASPVLCKWEQPQHQQAASNSWREGRKGGGGRGGDCHEKKSSPCLPWLDQGSGRESGLEAPVPKTPRGTEIRLGVRASLASHRQHPARHGSRVWGLSHRSWGEIAVSGSARPSRESHRHHRAPINP